MGFNNNFLLCRYDDLRQSNSWHNRIEKANNGDQGTVVLAEKNPNDLEHIATILQNLRFNVLTAQDGKTALTLAQQHLPVMVLSSLELPLFDGYTLSQKLREEKETESIPFMFIVGPGELPDRLVGHQTYAHDYIQKPISVPDFKSRINALSQMGKKGNASLHNPSDEAATAITDELPDWNESAATAALNSKTEKPLATGSQERAETTHSGDSLKSTLAEMRTILLQLSTCLEKLDKALSSGKSDADQNSDNLTEESVSAGFLPGRTPQEEISVRDWIEGTLPKESLHSSHSAGERDESPVPVRHHHETASAPHSEEETLGLSGERKIIPIDRQWDDSPVPAGKRADSRERPVSILEHYRNEYRNRMKNSKPGNPRENIAKQGVDDIFDEFLKSKSS